MDYILTFIEGMLTFISPCILPMLPVYFIYLAGVGIDEMHSSAKNRLALNSIGFILGFTLVFVLMGATVTVIGHFLTEYRELLRKIGGLIMVLFGLSFMGVLRLKFLTGGKSLEYRFGKLRFPGAVIFGMVFGFGWTPCLTVFLGSALALAGSSETISKGMLLLLLYSLGLGIPFFISAVIFDRIKGAFKLLQKHTRTISIVSGVLLILAGMLVFTDSLKYLI